MERVEDESPLAFRLQNAAAAENLQVVRDVGDVLAELLGELADVLLPAPQRLHDPQPVLIPERLEALGTKFGCQSGCLRKLLHAISIRHFRQQKTGEPDLVP